MLRPLSRFEKPAWIYPVYRCDTAPVIAVFVGTSGSLQFPVEV